MDIAHGLRPEHRSLAAAGYWQAFRGKLRWPLAPEARALDFIGRNLDPGHAISAVSPAGELLGVAGFKTKAGAFIGGGLAEMASIYGTFGSLWRGIMISVLERPCEPGTLLMDGIFVQPSARGKGVGTRLLQAVTEHAHALGLYRVRLDVIDSNPRARALYEREGFIATECHSMGPLRHVFGFRSATTMIRTIR